MNRTDGERSHLFYLSAVVKKMSLMSLTSQEGISALRLGLCFNDFRTPVVQSFPLILSLLESRRINFS